MLELWNSKGLFCIIGQQLVDQANNIHKRGWLTEIELEEIKKNIKLDNNNRNDTDPDVTPQDALYIIKKSFNEEEEKLFERLVTLMGSIEENEIPPMKNVDKKRLFGASTKVDTMLKKTTLHNITTLSKLMYCGGITISALCVKNSKGKQRIIQCARQD